MMVTQILIAVSCFAGGFIIAWLWVRASAQAGSLELEKRAATQQGASEERNTRAATLNQEILQVRTKLEEEQKQRITAESDAEAQRENLAEQRRLLDDAQKKLKEAFQSLA